MKKIIPILLILLILCGCGGGGEVKTIPETTFPMTETVPGSEAPPVETVPPTTVPPTTVPPTTVPPTTVPPTTVPVPDVSWFDDALFIGESRTAGLKVYGRLGNADYFCGEGLTVYGVLAVEASDVNFAEQSLRSLFARKQYGKIYIHLGINELGGNLNSYVAQYQSVIDEIRRLQPDAQIILQSVLALTGNYSTKPAFSRESIQDINSRIQTLAEENGLYFSDVNQIMTDDEGYLLSERTFDGCHLTPEGYEIWAQWLVEEASINENWKEKEQ